MRRPETFPPPVSAPAPMSRGTRSGLVAAVCLLLSTYGLNACSDGSEAEHRAPPASSPDPRTVPDSATDAKATTTTLALTPEEQVEAAYLAARAMFYELAQHPKPADRRIQEFAGGEHAAHVRAMLTNYWKLNIKIELPMRRMPPVKVLATEVAGNSAGVEACIVDNALQVKADTGALVDDTVESRTTVARMEFIERRWLLTELTTKHTVPGDQGCTK